MDDIHEDGMQWVRWHWQELKTASDDFWRPQHRGRWSGADAPHSDRLSGADDISGRDGKNHPNKMGDSVNNPSLTMPQTAEVMKGAGTKSREVAIMTSQMVKGHPDPEPSRK